MFASTLQCKLRCMYIHLYSSVRYLSFYAIAGEIAQV